jgi:hypothetical protein
VGVGLKEPEHVAHVAHTLDSLRGVRHTSQINTQACTLNPWSESCFAIVAVMWVVLSSGRECVWGLSCCVSM